MYYYPSYITIPDISVTSFDYLNLKLQTQFVRVPPFTETRLNDPATDNYGQEWTAKVRLFKKIRHFNVDLKMLVLVNDLNSPAHISRVVLDR